jgi:hypothetical protein
MISLVSLRYAGPAAPMLHLDYEEGDQELLISVKPGSAAVILTSLEVIVDFDNPVVLWRNFDYSWVDCDRERIANYYSPKILRLENGFTVAASTTTGLWHFDPRFPRRLCWKLIDKWLNPLIQYGEKDRKNFTEPRHAAKQDLGLKLLFTRGKVQEWSRSPLPFSAIVSFTDHCDFDSLPLLKSQRKFFKRHNIKVTKGFFLYHFSKRDYNPSFEKMEDAQELREWAKDGHELAYHSLSQSLKKREAAMEDFARFSEPEGLEIETWIDHGFQPYNFTMIAQSGLQPAQWSENIRNKKIKYLWNYLDSATSGNAIVNQLDPQQFVLKSYWAGLNGQPFRLRASATIRNYFLYHADADALYFSMQLATAVKKFRAHKTIRNFLKLLSPAAGLLPEILRLLASWNKKVKTAPWYAKFAPSIFEVPYEGGMHTVFQTMEVNDLVATFSAGNLEKLVKEKGLCIAHTYFAVPHAYHRGRMFSAAEGKLNEGVNETFELLGAMIREKKIWNPSLRELAEYFSGFRNIVFEHDADGGVRAVTGPATDAYFFREVV